jgi:hypothetical protein
MTSSFSTTCPGCGGKASTNDDDGITYCENYGPNGCHAKALKRGESGVGAGMHSQYNYFKPADRRGG